MGMNMQYFLICRIIKKVFCSQAPVDMCGYLLVVYSNSVIGCWGIESGDYMFETKMAMKKL
jgi:hypothetical protein